MAYLATLPLLLAALVPALLAPSASAACNGRAQYAVTLRTNWTPATSPSRRFPSFAHFSPTVLSSHNSGYSMWRSGDRSSNGVKDVAQFGFTRVLLSELEAAGFRKVFRRRSIGPPPVNGRQTFLVRVTATNRRTKISAISMIAPSPDWFIGLSGVETCSGSRFKDRITGQLFGYDAGTSKDGFQFTDISPRTLESRPISRLPGSFRAFGSYTIVKV